jgi:hypothetical protein
MEKFPKTEFGMINEVTVKDYIKRNYISKKEYDKVKADKAKILEYFDILADYIVEALSGKELMKMAISNSVPKKDCLQYFIESEDLYSEVLQELTDEDKIYSDE